MENNPYIQGLDAGMGDVLKTSPAEFISSFRMEGIMHWDREGSEWAYPKLASLVFAAAYLFTCPQSKRRGSSDVLSFIREAFSVLNNAAVDNRWWHKDSRKGDANIDRFTLLPYIEAYLVKNRLQMA